jgi:hypothetical protein
MKKIISLLLAVVATLGITFGTPATEIEISAHVAETTPIVETVPATTTLVVEQEVTPAEETKPATTEPATTTPVVEQETTPVEETVLATTEPADTIPVVEQETTPVEESHPTTTEPVVEQETIPATTEPVAHSHNYTVMVTAATCTEDGYTTYTCECGDCYHEGIKAQGHEYVTRNGAICSATCTEDGVVFYQCEHCGDTYTEVLEKAHGHEYVAEVVAPTEQDRGYTIHTCVHCGDSYVDNYTEPVPSEPEPDDWVYFYDPRVIAINGEPPVDMLRPGVYTITFEDGSSATLVVKDGHCEYVA